MKRAVLVAFCLITLCSLCLIVKPGTVKAYKAGYQADDYMVATYPTIDGKWTTTTEWVDSPFYQLGGGLNAVFGLKYETAPDFSYINQYYLIEILGDTTNDTGDYIQICYASAASFGGVPVGGTTPQTDCWLFNYSGHKASTQTVYRGNGIGWTTYTSWSAPTDFQVADTLSASTFSSTPHWIVEVKIEHMHFVLQPEFWIRVAAYDASNNAAGVQAWPPASSRDVPNDWGLLNAVQTAFPETLSVGVILLLSSVAVLVGSRYFRKRSKIESRSPVKIAKIHTR